MAPVKQITEAEILDALAAAVAVPPEEARTADELVEHTGLSLNRVRAALKEYQKLGRLQVHKALRPGIDGRQIYRPAYTITKK